MARRAISHLRKDRSSLIRLYSNLRATTHRRYVSTLRRRCCVLVKMQSLLELGTRLSAGGRRDASLAIWENMFRGCTYIWKSCGLNGRRASSYLWESASPWALRDRMAFPWMGDSLGSKAHFSVTLYERDEQGRTYSAPSPPPFRLIPFLVQP